jgi:hypothetical protein
MGRWQKTFCWQTLGLRLVRKCGSCRPRRGQQVGDVQLRTCCSRDTGGADLRSNVARRPYLKHDAPALHEQMILMDALGRRACDDQEKAAFETVRQCVRRRQTPLFGPRPRNLAPPVPARAFAQAFEGRNLRHFELMVAVQSVGYLLDTMRSDPLVKFFGIFFCHCAPKRELILPEVVHASGVSWKGIENANFTARFGSFIYTYDYVTVEVPHGGARRDSYIVAQRARRALELCRRESLVPEQAAGRAIDQIPNPFRDRTERKSAIRRVTRAMKELQAETSNGARSARSK